MRQTDIIKTIKITVGCCASFLIAEELGLKYSNSVITITLLSILGTRRDTFRTAGKRGLSFILALAAAGVSFILLPKGDVPEIAVNLLIYLAIFLTACQKFDLMEGFSMSTVLVLHLWREQEITWRAVGNEAALMAIGIFMGIIASLYMPDRVGEIRRAQRKIEALMRLIFRAMADQMETPGEGKSEPRVAEGLRQLKLIVRNAFLHAEYTEKNYVFKRKTGDYFRRYMEMREEQRQLLKRISRQTASLQTSYEQSRLVAGVMRDIAGSLEEHNNAEELLEALEAVRARCRVQPLPADRAEFEDRARLFGIMGLLKELLQAKQEFSAGLTGEEITRFWKFFLP